MKARPIDLRGANEIEDAMRRIATVRLAEVLAASTALDRGRSDELHAMRIACKRLRYALERFGSTSAAFEPAAVRLSHLQDALGTVHDRDVLLERLRRTLPQTSRTLRRERQAAVQSARALWHDGFAPNGPFDALVAFTKLGAASQGFGDAGGPPPQRETALATLCATVLSRAAASF